MLSLLYPLDGEVAGYSRDQFLADLVDEAEKDIRKCFAVGAARVSIDCTAGRLACRNDPWTGRHMLEAFVALKRKNIGIHTCPGGDCDSIRVVRR
jgi:hypothetical protein